MDKIHWKATEFNPNEFCAPSWKKKILSLSLPLLPQTHLTPTWSRAAPHHPAFLAAIRACSSECLWQVHSTPHTVTSEEYKYDKRDIIPRKTGGTYSRGRRRRRRLGGRAERRPGRSSRTCTGCRASGWIGCRCPRRGSSSACPPGWSASCSPCSPRSAIEPEAAREILHYMGDGMDS